MPIPVTVEREGGLFSTLGYPESMQHLDGFLRTGGLGDTPLGRSLAQAVPASELATGL